MAVAIGADAILSQLAVQPARPPPSVASVSQEEHADSHGDMEDLLLSIETVEEFQEFLADHTTYREADGAVDCLWDYRPDPDAFQLGGMAGPCNAFAELSATWASMHGGTPYVITLCPRRFSNKWHDPWHQIALCRLPGDRLCIFDNQETILFAGTLTEYLEKRHPRMELFFIGGIFRWKKVEGSTRAKLYQHLLSLPVGSNGLEEADLPHKEPGPPPPPHGGSWGFGIRGFISRATQFCRRGPEGTGLFYFIVT